jgi:hypothetical protein
VYGLIRLILEFVETSVVVRQGGVAYATIYILAGSMRACDASLCKCWFYNLEQIYKEHGFPCRQLRLLAASKVRGVQRRITGGVVRQGENESLGAKKEENSVGTILLLYNLTLKDIFLTSSRHDKSQVDTARV